MKLFSIATEEYGDARACITSPLVAILTSRFGKILRNKSNYVASLNGAL